MGICSVILCFDFRNFGFWLAIVIVMISKRSRMLGAQSPFRRVMFIPFIFIFSAAIPITFGFVLYSRFCALFFDMVIWNCISGRQEVFHFSVFHFFHLSVNIMTPMMRGRGRFS